MKAIDLQSRFLGGMVGSALGDAIGELAFRTMDETALRSSVEMAGTLTFTDDTAMAIGLAESITQMGYLDEQHLGDTFKVNFNREPWRGYASGPPTLFAMVDRQGVAYTAAARSLFGGQGSYGNGAAMRIAPVGLFFHNAPDLYEQVRLSAVVTHAHPVGIDGAAALAWMIAQVVQLDPQEPFPFERLCQGVADLAQTPEMRDKLALIPALISEDVSPLLAAKQLGRSVAAHESVPFAIYAFLRHPQSFEACLFCAILNGGDVDTLGAMACAISGAYLGIEAIPHQWREKIENRARIEALAIKLAQIKSK